MHGRPRGARAEARLAGEEERVSAVRYWTRAGPEGEESVSGFELQTSEGNIHGPWGDIRGMEQIVQARHVGLVLLTVQIPPKS